MPAEEKSEGKDEGKEEKDEKGVPLRERRLSTGKLINPLVADFSDFCTTEAFEGEVREFIDANCRQFAGVDLEDEQTLASTALHHDFIAIVERRLETFCKEHDTT